MKHLLLLVMLTLLGRLTYAQAPGTLTGRVVEASQAPVPFATVAVLAAADSSLVKADAADGNGTFAVAGLPAGRYRLRITAVGFTTYTSGPVASPAALGALVLRPAAHALGEVVVQGERPAVEHTLGKTVLNVANPLFKTASTALDVLGRAPGLVVSSEGALSIGGRYAPVVYLDGKQQPLTADELRNLQASDIEQVELINNASAQFDGETRAVINIKLKLNQTLGWKGSLYGGYTQNSRQTGYQVGGSATYKTSRWAYYGRAGYLLNPSYLAANDLRTVRDGDATTLFANNGIITTVGKPFSYQFSADYSLAKNHQLGVFAKGNYAPENQDVISLTDQSSQATATDPLRRTLLDVASRSQARARNVAFDLNYTGTLNSRGDQLLAFADYATYRTPRQLLLQNAFLSEQGAAVRAPFVLAGQFGTDITIRSLRVDYSRALGTAGKLLLGSKLVDTRSANDVRNDSLQAGDAATGTYTYDASRSNQFRYHEQIVAGYAQLSQTWGKTALEAGLRAENTTARGQSLTLDQVLDRQYFRWLPSLKVQQQLSEGNSLALSYSRKMERPAFWELNPAPLYTDYYSYVEGNPFLLPVTHNTASLSYQHKELTFSANYVLDRDAFVQIPLQNDQTKVIRYTRFNLGQQTQAWLDVSAPLSLAPWWKTQHYAQLSHSRTQSAYPSGGTIDMQGWQFSFNGSQVFTLPRGMALEVKYFYDSPTTSYIYHSYANGTVSLALRKDVLAKRGNVQLSVGDLFNTYRERFATQYQNIDVDIVQRRNSRQATLRFTYNFGQSTFNRKTQSSGSAEEENRAR
jgi:hypothetical protein